MIFQGSSLKNHRGKQRVPRPNFKLVLKIARFPLLPCFQRPNIILCIKARMNKLGRMKHLFYCSTLWRKLHMIRTFNTKNKKFL